MEILGAILAFALAFNIGANNAGVHMGPAFSVGARRKWTALILFALFTAGGAVLLGEQVSETVGNDLFTGSIGDETWLFLVLAPSVTLVLITLANIYKVPTPTTTVAVCSLIGVGLALELVHAEKFIEILLWWVISPVATLLLTWLFGWILLVWFPGHHHHHEQSPRAKRWIGFFLTVEGCYSAFAIGSNNLGNAVGPLLGSGTMSLLGASLLGAAGFVAGSLVWGGRVLETVGKGITELCYIRALVVGIISATAILIAAIYGAPISGAVVVTTGMIGFSLASKGVRGTADNRNVQRIGLFWVASPVVAIAVAYLIVLLVR